MRKNRQFTRKKNANFKENQLQMNEKRIRKFTKKKGNCVTKKRSIQKHKVVIRKQIFFGQIWLLD